MVSLLIINYEQAGPEQWLLQLSGWKFTNQNYGQQFRDYDANYFIILLVSVNFQKAISSTVAEAT